MRLLAQHDIRAAAAVFLNMLCEHDRREATQKVAVPEEIVNLLSDVRSFLQEKCEPPVYVSDRRLVKALALLQVSSSSCSLQ